MALVLNEEQELLRQTAREFCEEKSPISELRRLRDSQDADGIDRGTWREMTELGWAGVTLPEELGGIELGYLELGVIFEECGRTLAAHPLLSSVVLGSECVLRAGNEQQRKEILPEVADGKRLLSLAYQEGAHHAPLDIATSAKEAGDGFTLNGTKTLVLDGHIADTLVVAARSSGSPGDTQGLSLFLVDPNSAGVTVTRTVMIDGRNAARVVLENVQVPKDGLLGEVGGGGEALAAALDRGTVALCAEMLGSATCAFEKTLEYMKTREQFGVPIGSFQALKHRAANMFVELELARSIVMDALSAIDEGRSTAKIASIAKARCNDTVFLVGNECVQLFGGIGVTDEEDIGLYMKRARVTQAVLGNSAHHRDRFASLEGF